MLDHLKTQRHELQARGASLSASIAKLDSLRARVTKAEAALHEHDQDAGDAMLAVVDALIEERASELTAFHEFMKREVGPKVTRLFALHAAIVDMAKRHQNNGRTEQAMPLFQRAERLSYARPEIDLEPAPGAIITASSEWAKRFAELTSDAPATNVVAIGSAA